jgi:hypothetical protein
MPLSPVVLVGSDDDVHVAITAERVRATGVECRVLAPEAFLAEVRLTLGESLDDVTVDGAPLRPGCVYVRDLRAARGGEVLTGLLHRWDELGVPIYNGTLRRPRLTRPFQLALVRQAGIPVVETRWTNDGSEARRFAAGRRIAWTPLDGVTVELDEHDLDEERLADLRVAPVMLQALPGSEDVRAYVLDDEIIGAVRIAAALRGDRIEPVALSEAAALDCRRAAQALGLRFAGIDLRGDDGSLRFTAASASPAFVAVDELAGTEVGIRLAARLAAWGARPDRVMVRVRAASPPL